MQPTRIPLIVVATASVFSLVRVAWVWDALPADMASHFDGAGQPNDWMPKESLFAILAMVQIGVPLLLALVSIAQRRVSPSLINLPNRDYWLAPERKDEAMRRLGGALEWVAAVVAAFMAGALELVLRANLRSSRLETAAFALMLGMFLLAIAATIAGIYRAFRAPPVERH